MQGSFIDFRSTRLHYKAGDIFRMPKAWGEEQWIVNKEYCGKKLILKKNHRCSMHKHERKDEVFYLQSGKVLLEINGESHTLDPGDFVHIPQGLPHRFTGLADSEIVEFSTTHDEDDSYRTEFSGHVEQDRFDREAAIISSFGESSVLVVGDVMLDTYVSGDVSRISPEAPIPVMHFRSRRYVPGGAANAAANIASLGGKATLIGVCGRDDAGRKLSALLKTSGVTARLIEDSARCTTEKQRIVAGDAHQLVRVDYEETASVSSAVEKKMLDTLKKELPKHHVLLLSDYAKGICTVGFLKACIREAKRAGVPVVLDPKPQGPDYLDAVAGVTLLTPNRGEAQILTHDHRGSMAHVAFALAKKIGAAVLCTLGGEGMMLASPQTKDVQTFPALATGVVDVSGAGDTVVATIALSLASGASFTDAVDLANRAASIVVAKAGTATLTSDELLRAL